MREVRAVGGGEDRRMIGERGTCDDGGSCVGKGKVVENKE
jgi:hypothetical protein